MKLRLPLGTDGLRGEIDMNNIQHTSSFSQPATLRHVSTSAAVGYDIHEWLAHEALFLDHGRYDDWITLLATDLVYRCPAWVFNASSAVRTTVPAIGRLHDYDYHSVTTHAKGMRPTSSDTLPDFQIRRLVTNVIVTSGHRPKEFVVHSYVLITGAPRDQPEDRLMTVERQDTLRCCSRSFRLTRRELRLSPVAHAPSGFPPIF
jgi:3-phenylpropionate/cinnamic acid dioxygenase small subunit